MFVFGCGFRSCSFLVGGVPFFAPGPLENCDPLEKLCSDSALAPDFIKNSSSSGIADFGGNKIDPPLKN